MRCGLTQADWSPISWINLKVVRTSGCWEQVLAEAGPDGLGITEIAKRIQKQGLRDLRTSRTPEVCCCSK